MASFLIEEPSNSNNDISNDTSLSESERKVNNLKLELSDEQLQEARNSFFNIRKAFHSEYQMLGHSDRKLINDIKIHIMQNILAKEF